MFTFDDVIMNNKDRNCNVSALMPWLSLYSNTEFMLQFQVKAADLVWTVPTSATARETWRVIRTMEHVPEVAMMEY